MSNPYDIVKKFEAAVAEYCGSPHAVSVTSCTMALRLALRYWRWEENGHLSVSPEITVPSRTYISVPFQVIVAGCRVKFKDYEWEGIYRLAPSPVIDSARFFTSGMYVPGTFMCTSHHWTKTLSIGQGGIILTDNPDAVRWLKAMRFDGRTEGVSLKDDDFSWIRHMPEHCYMSPRDAAEGLSRLSVLPKHNDPLPNDDYPDLSQFEVFK